MDKDGRNRNRLSHTSAPLYFAKSKRPNPSDVEGVGATNRLPGGQQPLPRRQRSIHTEGKWIHTMLYSSLYSHTVFNMQTQWGHLFDYWLNVMVLAHIVTFFLLSQEKGQLPLWLVYTSWRQINRSQHKGVQRPRAAGGFLYMCCSIELKWWCSWALHGSFNSNIGVLKWLFFYVDTSYTISLHGSKNSSISQITLYMTWVHTV